MRPTTEHGEVYRDAEYKRLGTISLLAGIDLLTGEAIPLVNETHKSSDFIEFLRILDRKYPVQDTIGVILDNHSAHTSKETRRFLDTMPKGHFEFVFTPKHGSWLNMIESFFSKMTKQMLRGIRVSTKEELVERIYQYFDNFSIKSHLFGLLFTPFKHYSRISVPPHKSKYYPHHYHNRYQRKPSPPNKKVPPVNLYHPL